VPNGADAPLQGIPSAEVKIPGVPAEATSFGALFSTIGGFIGGLFGGGRGPTQAPVPAGFEPSGKFEGFIDVRTGAPPTEQVLFGAERGNPFLLRALIPTPAQGGPPLVTERFQALPGPFVPEPDLPILQELGIPFPEEIPQLERFQPDVRREEMAVDSPLLAGFGGLPAVRTVAGPTISGFLGGLAQDVVSGFLRAPQELGMAQVPGPVSRTGQAIQPFAQEKPSTRILRQIHAVTGVRVKLSSAKALIRQLGLQNGARCLGISVTDACTLIITSSPRRRRGISGSDIRIVKRTARRFQALQEDLSGLVSRRRAAPRRRRHVHAIQHTAPAP